MFGATNPTLAGTMAALVASAVAAGEIFYGRDLANRAKQAGQEGREGDMTHLVRQAFLSGEMPGYEQLTVIKVTNRQRGDTHPVFLYQPVGTAPEVTAQHAARTVDALPPVSSTPPKGLQVPDGTLVDVLTPDPASPAIQQVSDSLAALAVLGVHIVDPSAQGTAPDGTPAPDGSAS